MPANAQLGLGRLPEAVTLYHWAVEIDPRRREAHNNLGNALLQLGDRKHAIDFTAGRLS